MKVTTDEQFDFIDFFDTYALPLLSNSKIRNNARYEFYEAMGDNLLGVKRVMEFLELPCDFDNEAIEPFIDAIKNHLSGVRPSRETLPDQEKERLLEIATHRCNICKKPVKNIHAAHFDHIIPFYLVFDTITNNRQCLCPECNRKKGNKIGRPNRLNSIQSILVNQTICESYEKQANKEIA